MRTKSFLRPFSLLAAVISVFVASCELERVIPYELPFEGQKLVVWSFLQPYETVSVKVYPTYPPLGKDTVIVIDDAVVELYENDSMVALLQHSEKGIYTSDFYPVLNKDYHLRVYVPHFEDTVVSDKVQIPRQPSITSVIFQDSVAFPTNTQIDGRLVLTINTANENFLLIERVDNPADTLYPSNLVISNLSYIYNCLEGTQVISTDCLLNPNQLMGQLRYSIGFRPESVTLRLATISLDYAEFMNTYTDIEEGLGFVSEPVNRYSNLRGGYGLLATYHPFDFSFDL